MRISSINVNKILIFFIIFSSNFVFSITPFEQGFKEGFPIGYCKEMGDFCVAPPTPICPLVRVNESNSNYFDGYNRGLIDGLRMAELNKKKKLESELSSISTYKALDYSTLQNRGCQIEPSVVDLDGYSLILKNLDARYEKSKSITIPDDLAKVVSITNEYIKAENVEVRKQFISFTKSKYYNFKSYPSTIPDGVYSVTMIDDKEGSTECIENCSATVINNKVVYIFYTNILGDNAEISDKNYFRNYTFENPYSLFIGENKEIKDGFMSFKLLCDIDLGVKMDIRYKIYFNDYIALCEKAIFNDSELKKKYTKIVKFQPISDGWHKAFLTNNLNFCEVRYTYVENNKVLKYLNSKGKEILVQSGGLINNAKTIIQLKVGPWKNNTGKWTNSQLTQDSYLMYEIYFID